jgi:hypothetical protein
MPKDIRNKDITTRMFVLGEEGNPAKALGPKSSTRLKKHGKNCWLWPTMKRLQLVCHWRLKPIPAGSDKPAGPTSSFRQMPVAACFPILGKIQSDAKASSSAVLNYCLKQVAGEDIKFDAFQPAISAPKGYVIAGEKYEADVFLSAYSTRPITSVFR